MTKQNISDTLNEAVKRSGTQSALAKKQEYKNWNPAAEKHYEQYEW